MNNQQQPTVLSTDTAGPETPGFEWLGHGYKGYQCYADLESKTPYPVYDMSNVQALFDDINKGSYETYEATSKSEYYNQRFAKLKATGNYEMYSATVTANFEESTLRSCNVTIGTAVRIQKNYLLTVPDNTPLDKSFVSDLLKLTPEKLFDKYGTHVLKSFIVGARYEASSYLEDDKTENKSKAAASLSGGLKLVFNMDVDGGSENKEAEQTVKGRAVIKSYGGGMEKDYTDWFAHLQARLQDKKYVAIAAFEDDSLMPLYEVLEDNDPRKAVLKSKFNEYMAAHAAPIMLEPDPLKPSSPAATALKYNDQFMLQTEDGNYVVSYAGPGSFGRPVPCYPMLRKAEGVRLYFSGEKTGDVDLGKHVYIRTTEKTLKEDNYLGRFLDSEAYYSFKGRDEEKWVVKKKKAGADSDHLFYGDLVEISMLDWPDYLLCQYGDYLSTTGLTSIGCGTTSWRIVQCS